MTSLDYVSLHILWNCLLLSLVHYSYLLTLIVDLEYPKDKPNIILGIPQIFTNPRIGTQAIDFEKVDIKRKMAFLVCIALNGEYTKGPERSQWAYLPALLHGTLSVCVSWWVSDGAEDRRAQKPCVNPTVQGGHLPFFYAFPCNPNFIIWRVQIKLVGSALQSDDKRLDRVIF